MGTDAIDTNDHVHPREHVLLTATGSQPRRLGAQAIECYPVRPVRANLDGDPSYWTAYDYYMIEREKRARRRARVYATIARLGNWLLLRLMALRTRTETAERIAT